MSRMSGAQALNKPEQSTEAAAIVAVMHEMQAMDRKWATWRAEMGDRFQQADALITGLHQDNANMMVRQTAFMRWAQKHWSTFNTDIQAEYEAVLAEVTARANEAVPTITPKEGSDEESNPDHVSV